MASGWTRAATSTVATLVLVALGSLAFEPAFGAWFVDDDLPLLALARMLENPLWLLVSDHMFGMPYYRPVGSMFWWLTAAVAGDSAFWQYTISLGLHVAVATTLWWLVSIMSGRKWLSFGAAALFVVHPTGIVTATWLSDRFDLLAAWFGLLALGTAWRYRQRATRFAWLACMGFLLLALGSKEVAFAVAPAIAVIWLWPGARVPRRAVLWLALPVFLVLGARALVLGGFAASRLFAGRDLLTILGSGLGSWFGRLPMYVSYWPWLDTVGLVALLLAVVLVLGAMALRFLPFRDPNALVPPVPDESRVDLWCAVAAGITLVIAAGLVQ